MCRMNTVLLGNRRGSDGIYAFSREILFRPAGRWVTDALPREMCGEVYYLSAQEEAGLDDVKFVSCEAQARYQTLSQTAGVFEGEHVLLIAAPMPELSGEDYQKLINLHLSAENDATLLCCDGGAQEPFVIIRNGQDEVTAVGQGEGERALHAAVFRTGALKDALAQGGDALYDLFNHTAKAGGKVGACPVVRVTEIVSGMDAYHAQKSLMQRINFAHIEQGVMVFDPENTYIAPDAVIGAGAQILPGTMIRGGCQIGADAKIGPNTILEEAIVGEGTTVNSSQMYESTIGSGATVGPFAYIRPGCVIGDKTRIGDFVELKKAQIGNGTKVSHLTYIGDAEVGERVNFGCGTVVVNYDGYHKYKTVIGDDCFIGCNTNLVSPLTLGDRVFTAAGTTVTKDVPDGALAMGRARQQNMEGWNDRRREKYGKK